MSDLPVPWQGGRPTRTVVKATRAAEKTSLAIYEAELAARFRSEVDQIDSRAIADAVKGALDEEMCVLDEALAAAGDSLAKRELISRKLEIMSRINSQRIARRFEG